MAEFGARMRALNRAEFGRSDMREWIVRATEGGTDSLISSYCEGLVEKGRVDGFPYSAQALNLVVKPVSRAQCFLGLIAHP